MSGLLQAPCLTNAKQYRKARDAITDAITLNVGGGKKPRGASSLPDESQVPSIQIASIFEKPSRVECQVAERSLLID